QTISGLNIGIALDPEWICINDTYGEIFEYERAYGVYYDLPTRLQGILRNRGHIISIFYNPMGTDLNETLNKDFRFPIKILIKLEVNNDRKVLNFNIHEFSNYRCRDYFLNRSAHGYYDITTKFFNHIDGKALLVNGNNYHPDRIIWSRIQRWPKRKLFRIDGNIPEKYFVALITRFFLGNDLIEEFFNPF
ncbi:unnamed protein product, partial [marine sediment metagenome]